MKTISTTNIRKNIGNIIDFVRESGRPVALTRQNEIEAVIVKYPKNYSANFDEVTNINLNSGAFEFLKDEPDIYTAEDIKKRYA
jgi:PHD/YefM family antitoxin component YafN of YafNO toxin-antitoxin module